MKKTNRMNRKVVNWYMRRLKRWTVLFDKVGKNGAAEARLSVLLGVARNRAWRAGPLPGKKITDRLAAFNKINHPSFIA
jgi:hypothetical protein